MIIKRLAKFFGRRRKKASALPHSLPPSAAVEESGARPRASGGTLITWESELRAIAAETSAWTVETGGDLFGRWQANPTVFLATKAGPNAQRDNAHFRLDVDYLRQLSEPLAADWALRYFGDWHSHHRLGLLAPSSGDRRRIRQLGNRNAFPNMAEIIVTTEGSEHTPTVRIHPWFYDLSSGAEPTIMPVKVLSGCSPVRQAIISRGALPEQTLPVWESVPLERIRIGDAAHPPALEPQRDVDATTRERILTHLTEALKVASGAPIEQHATAFGHILVATLKEPHHLAFAIDKNWPMNVLEVHRLDRAKGSAEPINTDAGMTVLDVRLIVEAFRTAKAGKGAA
jgi:hypothetical protein